MPITLQDEIADLQREIAHRKKHYQQERNAITDPRRVAELKAQHDHQLACTEATLLRLYALIPQQASLFQ